MQTKRTFIDRDALVEAMHRPGYFKYVDGKHLYIPPYDVIPPEGYERNEKFPFCCSTHSKIYEEVNRYMAVFPNCCEGHVLLSKKTDFDTKDYSNFAQKYLNVISYTEFQIVKSINTENWYEDIVDYIEYCWDSLGHPPTLTGYYFQIVKNCIKYPPTGTIVPNEKAERLNEFIDNVTNIREEQGLPDVNLLRETYRRWLKVFPFHLSFFAGQVDRFNHAIPILAKEPVLNKYSGQSKTALVTSKQLLNYLYELTKSILSQVNTIDLYKEGKISDFAKQQIELINASHQIRQTSLLGDFSKGEMKYITALKKWLRYEKEYFREVSVLMASKCSIVELTKAEKMYDDLHRYGFDKLPKVSSLNENQRRQLIDKLASTDLPYQIAMFNFLGYLDYLMANHFPSKFRFYKIFSEVLRVDERAIKGNISVLSPKSKERLRKRYTAHQHIESVEKDYNSLK